MKIIEEGNYGNVFPMTVECKRVADEYGFEYGKENDFCGSKLEIEAEDIKKHKWFKYPYYTGVDYGIVCPVCGKFVVVNVNKIPSKILNNAEEVRLNT